MKYSNVQSARTREPVCRHVVWRDAARLTAVRSTAYSFQQCVQQSPYHKYKHVWSIANKSSYYTIEPQIDKVT